MWDDGVRKTYATALMSCFFSTYDLPAMKKLFE